MKILQVALLFCIIEGITISSSLPQNRKGGIAATVQSVLYPPPVAEPGPKPPSSGGQCPGTTLLIKYRHDEEARKCGLPGLKEHCAENMIFYAIPESQTLGQCDCSHRFGEKPLIYHPKTKKCYFTYEQSYCRPGQWLVFNQYGNPVCTKNTCAVKQDRPGFGDKSVEVEDLVPFQGNGPCVKLSEPYRKCKPDEIVTFVSGRLTPTCGRKVEISVKAISPIENLTCEPGSYVSLAGNCRPSFVW